MKLQYPKKGKSREPVTLLNKTDDNFKRSVISITSFIESKSNVDLFIVNVLVNLL